MNLLAENVTLIDIFADLAKPKDYLRQVLANMQMTLKLYPTVVLRIGRTGSGKAPHYRFDEATTSSTLFGSSEQVRYLAIEAYHGRSHARLVAEGEEGDILREGHWSTKSMTHDEVSNLLGQARAKRV